MSRLRPSVDGERREATEEGAGGEHELGSRDTNSRPRSPRPRRTRKRARPTLSRGAACLGPGGPAGVAPFHGGWHPAATETQGGSGQRAVFHGSSRSQLPVLELERDADGWASCLPLAREVGIRAAGEKARNFVVSPVSIHAALALAAAGACGETQRELLAFVGAGSLAELHRAGATELVGRLPGLPQTSFASGVWVGGHTSSLKPEFVDVAASRYAAVAESADFATKPEEERRRINAFVSEATKGHFQDLLPPDSVTTSTVVVLANALYFKGTWALQFDRSRTFLAPFHLPDGVSTVQAPFMRSAFEKHRVAVFPGFKALKLPYKNQGCNHAAFYMLLLLPDGKLLTISDLYDQITSTPGFIGRHTPVYEVPVGRFMVPKFKFTFQFQASDDMNRLGVTRAFGGGDLSGMLADGSGLFISGVYHRATIEVDEQGTVATAVTTMCFMACARPTPPVDFVADRPFLFAIVEQRTGAVMFIGHVVNPLAT